MNVHNRSKSGGFMVTSAESLENFYTFDQVLLVALSGLSVGGHRVDVRGIDSSGELQLRPTSETWTVNSPLVPTLSG
jgi:hypothetical protein